MYVYVSILKAVHKSHSIWIDKLRSYFNDPIQSKPHEVS